MFDSESLFRDLSNSEAEMAQKLKNRKSVKLISGTGNTSAQVTPDGVSLVFQSVKHGHTIHWSMSDWNELKKWVDSRIQSLDKTQSDS